RGNGDLSRELAVRDRRRDESNVADLGGQVGGERVDALREVLPCPRYTRDLCLAAQRSFRAYLARHARPLGGERAELVHHRVDGVLEREDLATNGYGDLLREVAVGDGGRDVRDVTDLVGEISREDVDVVGEILPGSAHAFHVGLTAQLALGSDFASDASDF